MRATTATSAQRLSVVVMARSLAAEHAWNPLVEHAPIMRPRPVDGARPAIERAQRIHDVVEADGLRARRMTLRRNRLHGAGVPRPGGEDRALFRKRQVA